jgi:predicted branched-subunit amino acid permease
MHMLAPAPHDCAPAPTSTRHAAFAGGASAMAPWLIGVVPFGLVIGVNAARADIPLAAGWLTGPLIFGGSAQVATIQLLDAGAAPFVIVISALAINLRLILYSASMARHWRGAPAWWQALGAYFLVDPSVAVASDGYDCIEDRRLAHMHYVGAALTLWVAWLLAITAGATAGAALPSGLRLEMVIPLFLTGEVVFRLRDRATACAAAVAAVAAIVTVSLPMHAGLVVAIVVGLTVGVRMERKQP